MFILAAVLLSVDNGGDKLEIEGESLQIDSGRSVFVDVVSETSRYVALPDLRDRTRGFSLAEDDVEEPKTLKDGRMRQVAHWRLVPEPCAKAYKIAVFEWGGKVAGPLYFEPPAPLGETPSGPMEITLKKVFPPLTWRRLSKWLSVFAAVCLALYGVFYLLRFISQKVKEHKMSPIERAWVELDRLLKKGLPGRGKYKDFYVELTQLVRRYIMRKYGVKAPTLTTEEFLGSFTGGTPQSMDALREFLQSADMVKFAGVEATPEMSDEATERARGYLTGDSNDVR